MKLTFDNKFIDKKMNDESVKFNEKIQLSKTLNDSAMLGLVNKAFGSI